MIYQQWMLLKRVFAGHTPLRLTVLMSAINIAIGIGTFYYMTVVIGMGHGARAEAYRFYGGPAGFMAVGVAMNAMLTVGLSAMARAVSDERDQGTLGFWLMCQSNLRDLLLRASLGEFLLAAVNGVVTFIVLVMLFGVHFHVNLVSLLAVALVSLAAVVGVGLWAAGLSVAGWKGQNPVVWAWGLTTTFMAGIYVPIEIFTQPIIHTLALVVPITHALLAMRSAVLRDAPITDPYLDGQLLYMAAFAAIVLPLGAWQFQRGLQKALRDGKLIES